MASRLKIKIGPVEVEYEGEEKFLKEELPALLKAVSNLHKASGLDLNEDTREPDAGAGASGRSTNHLTTSVVASKLGRSRMVIHSHFSTRRLGVMKLARPSTVQPLFFHGLARCRFYTTTS
jgi:hypothetical protein